ncbi:MAG TPA: NTP transferase domain-containing protein [Anaerolineae bacterium]|nr:NTP transferase domain-containing protein [Anaerolineae bacterium]
MSDDYFALIMAGGGGTRLWPLSRRTRPKQLLKLVGDRSLFQMTVDRLLPLIPAERIHVVTIEEQADALREQVPVIPEGNFLKEPCPRGTASVIGLGAIMLQERYGDCVMACLPADHYMKNDELFRNCLSAAYELAKQEHLVTLGITPTHPSTGYGYIHRKERLGNIGGLAAYSVEGFKEKPSASLAETYIEQGDYAWNSGMFIWKPSVILNELGSQMPDLTAGLNRIREALGRTDQKNVLDRVWVELQSETIDYGVMEGAEKVAMIVADELGWFDIGGWSGLVDILQEDQDGNLLLGNEILAIDTNETLVFQEDREEERRLIALLGVKDLIVVESGNAILICPRARAEEVRLLVERLNERRKNEYL